MLSMTFDAPNRPLAPRRIPPEPLGPYDVRLRVHACGVCRTDLHVAAGELTGTRYPIVPGHQIVGTVTERGRAAELPVGARVGVPWLAWTCGECRYCTSDRENLCERALFTGHTVDGGFAESVRADSRYCLPIPGGYSSVEAAPLLCAGVIGYRALRMTGEARRLGFYGFGAAAHILVQVARALDREVYALTRPGDVASQELARRLGAVWAGDSTTQPPVELDAAIIFAAVGALVPQALAAVGKAGTVVCAGIHMSDIPSFPYRLIWGERVLRSVANLTRRDGRELMEVAARQHLHTAVTTFPLASANEALQALDGGRITGAAVLVME